MFWYYAKFVLFSMPIVLFLTYFLVKGIQRGWWDFVVTGGTLGFFVICLWVMLGIILFGPPSK